MSNDIARIDNPSGALSLDSLQELKSHVALVQAAMREVLREGADWGTVPGTAKPTLLQPGAQKLAVLFRLAPEYLITKTDLPGGHQDIAVTCRLLHQGTGHLIGSGVGSCSTMESKYRWRGGARKCPKCGKEAIKKSKYPPRNNPNAQPGYYCYAKVGGCGFEFAADDPEIVNQSEERSENPDIADTYNTVLKMSKKRALVDAIVTATAASDIFTQDLEETHVAEHVPDPPRQQAPQKPATAPPKRQVAQTTSKPAEPVQDAVSEPAKPSGNLFAKAKESIASATDFERLDALQKLVGERFTEKKFTDAQAMELTNLIDAKRGELESEPTGEEVI